ncbi:MAG: peptidoglycan DD-metalloendopeptidase family protein [Candidatus Paceibacterota bacterium]
MKQYQDYKMLYKRIIVGMLFISFLAPFSFLSAQTAEELHNRINEKNNEIVKLESQIKQFQQELEKLSKEKNSLSNTIKQLDLSRKKLVTDIAVTQNKIDKTNFRITELNMEIGNKSDIIKNNLSALSLEIRNKNEIDEDNIIRTLFSNDNFSNIWNDISNISSIQKAIIRRTNELRDAKVVLEDTKEKTTKAKNELVTLHSQLSAQKKIVEQNTSEKKKLLSQTKNSEANYQKVLKEQIALKNAFEKELEEYESKLKFILDPNSLPNAGVLSWPLNSIFVTQFFGVTAYSKRLYRSGSHSGVDFRASVGTPVKAMADGIVKGVGDTDITCYKASFGKWVLIEYDNGLSSTYGHLSFYSVKKGQKVKRGEIVAYSGNTGHTTGPHLHVSLYASRDASGNSAVNVATVPSKSCPGRSLTQPVASQNAYLDPMYYLPPYK